MNPHHVRSVHARRVWDSRGRPTVEAEVMLEDGAIGRAIVPAGASKGTREALELRDAGPRFGGLDVMQAVGHVNGEIARALTGCAADDQAGLDQALVELDGTPAKTRLGANATLAVSMAAAHAVAASLRLPLYQYLGGADACLLPMPQIQIFGGGAHAGRRVDIQDFMVVCPGAQRFAQALEWTAEVYRCAGELMQARGPRCGVADEGGWWPDFKTNEQALETLVAAIERAGFVPGSEVAIALDVAASEFGHGGRYTLGLESRELDADGLSELLLRWIDKYPIVSIEDPLAEDDWAGWTHLTAELGDKVQLVGDDLYVTNPTRLADGIAKRAGNSILVKVNQIGTLTETLDAVSMAQRHGMSAILSHRSGETEDTTIADLAVATDCGQIKTGAPARSERVAKYNQLLRIEEELGEAAVFAGRAAFPRFTA
jgi:enolase